MRRFLIINDDSGEVVDSADTMDDALDLSDETLREYDGDDIILAELLGTVKKAKCRLIPFIKKGK